MASKVELQSKSGRDMSGEIVWPAGDAKVPAVIVFHEWWGLNDHIRSIQGRLAADGVGSLAIDLYDGKSTTDAGEAEKLMMALDGDLAVERALGTFDYLRAHGRSNGKVGAMGFCLGGALTFRAACALPELGAAVPFYGVPDPKRVDYTAVRAPVLAHFATRDEWAKAEKAEAIKDQITASGGTMELFVYDADHAFVNDTRPEVYSDVNAKLAWARTIDFLKKHLG